jgi:hypothetical protein
VEHGGGGRKPLIYIEKGGGGGGGGLFYGAKYPLCGLLCSAQSCHFVRIRWVGGRWGSEGRGGGRSGEGGRSV